MRKYYIEEGIEKLGPYTLLELKEQGVTPNTRIWYAGLRDYVRAADDKQIQVLFELTDEGSSSASVVSSKKDVMREILSVMKENEHNTRIIARNVLWFFWLSIISLVGSLIWVFIVFEAFG